MGGLGLYMLGVFSFSNFDIKTPAPCQDYCLGEGEGMVGLRC